MDLVKVSSPLLKNFFVLLSLFAVVTVVLFVSHFYVEFDSTLSLGQVRFTNATSKRNHSLIRKLGDEFQNETDHHRWGWGCNAGTRFNSWKSGVVMKLEPRVKPKCDLLWNKTEDEMKRVKAAVKEWKISKNEGLYLMRMTECTAVKEEFLGNFYTSQMELDYPLAFTLVIYTAPLQVIRLLKTIYRPHNVYCIHPDAKQGTSFVTFFKLFSHCLDNVFVASRLVDVYYGHSSILEAQLSCMEDLITYKRWHYAINLVGRELALMTNKEIVQSLVRLKGESLVISSAISPETLARRFTTAVSVRNGKLIHTKKRLGPIPFNIALYKGSTYVAITRDFMKYILTDRKAVAFRKYLQEVKSPEECFYGSLFYLPEAREHGGFQDQSIQRPRLAVVKAVWLGPSVSCAGFDVHGICVLGSGDLPHIELIWKSRSWKYLFLNKYFMDYDHVIADCMEGRLIHRNIQEYTTDCMSGNSLLSL